MDIISTQPFEINEELLTYKLILEYDGTYFRGWQIQPNQRTVQAELEKAVGKLFGEPLAVAAAGRTDAGVHATGQVAHFRSKRERSTPTVFKALNALLPPDVRVKNVRMETADFHSRFSAKWRAYSYRISRRPAAIGRFYHWYNPKPLDIAAMRQAAECILGERQFQSFAQGDENEVHFLSSVYRAEWLETDDGCELQIEANRFVRGMVRLLVGTFVDVGRGKISVADMKRILDAHNVAYAGPKAPACGLTFTAAGYHPWQEL